MPLWRGSPPPSTPGNSTVPAGAVFPSGRQALTAALERFGLGRKDRIAVPEWSSACVIAAVGRQATPVPLADVLAQEIPVGAVIVYEQWGWPFTAAVLERIADGFPGIPVILDKVDSTPIAFAAEECGSGRRAEIWSLSKALGLNGGGLLRVDGAWAEFADTDEARRRLTALEAMEDSAFTADVAKSEIACVRDSVRAFVAGGDLESTYRHEAEARRRNLSAIAAGPAARNWEPWMTAALETECGPGIAPLFRGDDIGRLGKIADALNAERRIEAAVYHFDFSGDPLLPNYEPCLAVPVHGTADPDVIAEALEDTLEAVS